jgi:hypothetical protein
MAKTEMFFIVGGIAAGVAIAGSLFLLYPDMMFKNTSFQAQQSGELPDLGGATTTTTTTTASAGTNGTNSSAGNTTSGVQGSTSAPPPTGSPY